MLGDGTSKSAASRRFVALSAERMSADAYGGVRPVRRRSRRELDAGGLQGTAIAYSGRCVRDNRRNFVELPTDLALGDFYIVSVLEIHPELCGGTEHLAETQGGIGGDPSCFRRDAFDARTWQVTSLGERTSGQIERQKKFFSQNFSGMHGSKFFRHYRHSIVLAVIQS